MLNSKEDPSYSAKVLKLEESSIFSIDNEFYGTEGGRRMSGLRYGKFTSLPY